MSPTMNAPVPIPETPLTQAAANRIAKVFRGNPEEIAAWLDLIHLNATTTMAMMFQDPSIPDSRQAAAESSQALIENARQLSSAAKLLPEQAEQFVGAHQRAIDEFNLALELAMRRGAGAFSCCELNRMRT